mgnify:CR=1 FL=1
MSSETLIERMAAILMGNVNAPEWQIYRTARLIAETHTQWLEENGLVIVPREPTEAMSNAGVMTFANMDRPSAQPYRAWLAMIDATPTNTGKGE